MHLSIIYIYIPMATAKTTAISFVYYGDLKTNKILCIWEKQCNQN